MKRRIPQSKTVLTVRRPTNFDTKTWKSIESIFKASHRAQRATGRFKFYPYLVEVYRTCKEWKDLGVSKTMSRRVAEAFKIPRRKSTSPVRTLIDATCPALDPKQKSRWSRALELAAMAQATPKQLPNLLKNYAGISGCARLAAKQKKAKKETYRDDWAPAPRPRAQLANWEPLAALPAQKGLTLHSPDCHVGESHPKKTFSTLSANG